jgi:cobalamin biosynthesis Mg chelatase CobN
MCLCLAAGLSLGTTALASADPSGSEYLPSVPSATGHHPANGAQASGAQSGQSQPSASGSSTTITQESAGTTGASQPDQPKKAGGSKDKKAPSPASPTPVASTDTASSDGGSSGLPIILLIVAGVIAVAVGMTLRRRQGGGSDPGAGEGNKGDQSHTPRTPDGEIVADQHEAA